jgi:hypothetical protein
LKNATIKFTIVYLPAYFEVGSYRHAPLAKIQRSKINVAVSNLRTLNMEKKCEISYKMSSSVLSHWGELILPSVLQMLVRLARTVG